MTSGFLPSPANNHAQAWIRLQLVAVAFTFGLCLSLHRLCAQTLELPPLHVEAPTSCIDVQVEGARSLSFDCLNQQLKDTAQEHGDSAPVANAKDVTGTGAPTTVGTFSYTGTAIRMGNAFGKSAISQRPPATSFTNALVTPVPGAR